MPKKSVTITPAARHVATSQFEQRVTETLKSQDEMLDRLDKKLDSPILNGGFNDLMTKVNKIETIQDELGKTQTGANEKITAIHAAIYNPDDGLYAKVKDTLKWINTANWIIKGLAGILATGMLTAFGVVVYDLLTGTIHIGH